MADRIPLFPLELVLFPGAKLPLHIFEPRYREMVGECIAKQMEFGIVCAFPEAPGEQHLEETSDDDDFEADDDAADSYYVARIGCTARITAIPQRYDDGRMDILCLGVRRFRVKRIIEERSFREAEVEWIVNEDLHTDAKQRARIVALHNKMLMLAFEEGSAVDLRAPEHCEHLAFALGHMLPFDLRLKQAILESDSEQARLAILARAYQALITRAESVIHTVESAPKHVM